MNKRRAIVAAVFVLWLLLCLIDASLDRNLGQQAFAATPADSPAAGSNELAGKVKDIIAAKCIECHSPSATFKDPAIVNDARDSSHLPDAANLKDLKDRFIKNETVPNNTQLIQILTDAGNPMPPAEANAKLTSDDIKTIKDWISIGSPVPQISEHRDTITSDDILGSILNDVLKYKPIAALPSLRYFTLSNFYSNNNESPAQLDLYRQGFFKMLNSLSWKPNIVVPQAIDAQKTIFRVDLRDIGWTAEQWQTLVDQYPYGIDYDTPLANALYGATKSHQPFLRADWFVFQTSQSPLYYDLLGIPDGNNALTKLEAMLNVNRIRNIQTGNAIRAGIASTLSGVSSHNRLVERHAMADAGAYWISYDFGSDLEESDLAVNPLGPAGTLKTNFQFKNAGGEVIFSLPNGLQGYLLVKAPSERLNKAPIEIVHDDRNGLILNAISCINCHSEGMQTKFDDFVLQQVVNDQQKYSADEFKLLNKLYVSKAEMQLALGDDKARFIAAMKKADVVSINPEPVRYLFDRFIKNVDLDSAAAEIGLTPDELETKLQSNADTQLHSFSASFKAKTVPRLKFVDKFDPIIKGLDLGSPRKIHLVDSATLTNTTGTLTNTIGMALVKIAPGSFVMGSPASEVGRYADETQHKVTLTKGFLMGTTPVTQAQWKALMGNNPSHFQGDDLPVEEVSWNDAVDFCNKLSQKEGKHYRLPTEAEWEYACRAGTTTAYYSGNGEAALAEDGWYNANSNQQTHPVGQKKPNAWGLYDMLGNVWQWCGDRYGDYPSGEGVDLQGPANGEARVLRGGSWNFNPQNCRSSLRSTNAPDLRNLNFGFRLVLDSE